MKNKYMLIEAEDGFVHPVRFFDTEEKAREAAQVRFCEVSGDTREELQETLSDDVCASLDWENGILSYWDDRSGKEYGWRVQAVGDDKRW